VEVKSHELASFSGFKSALICDYITDKKKTNQRIADWSVLKNGCSP
jgi:hypothetical protein